MKNPAALLLLLGLALVLAYSALASIPSQTPQTAPETPPPAFCKSGQMQACSVNSCSGVSTCIDGIWGGCKWEKICEPGSRAACIEQGCAFAFKECNECGTGYGECLTG